MWLTVVQRTPDPLPLRERVASRGAASRVRGNVSRRVEGVYPSPGPSLRSGPPSPARGEGRRNSWQPSRPDLPGPADTVVEAGELLDADRPARMEAPGGNADLGAEAELPAVGELGGSVVQDDGGV